MRAFKQTIDIQGKVVIAVRQERVKRMGNEVCVWEATVIYPEASECDFFVLTWEIR